MRHMLQLPVALAISSLFLVSPVAAASNQGLSWAAVKGDVFNFHLTTSGVTMGPNVNEALFMNVTSDPPSIPNSITAWAQVPCPNVGWYWSNETAIGLYGILFLGLLYFGTAFVLPIGNFTLIGNVIKTYTSWNSTATTYVNNTLYWGLKCTLNQTQQNTVIQVSYLKSDGVLARYTISATNNTSHATERISFIRDGLPKWVVTPVSQTLAYGQALSYQLQASDPSSIGQWQVNDTLHFAISSGGLLTNASTLASGTYGVAVTAYDMYDGHFTATFNVTVQPQATITLPPLGIPLFVWLGAGGGIVAAVLIVLLLRRRS